MIYRLLLAILLVTYGIALSRVKQRSVSLTPLLGWLAGLGFFLLAPLTVLTFHGGYELPPADGMTEAWTKVKLANPAFFRPYLVVWLAMMATCAAAALSGTRPNLRGGRRPEVSILRLERAIRLLMALSVVDWILYVWLVGGVAEFAVSHWYLRNLELSASLGDSFTWYTRLSLTNQLLL